MKTISIKISRELENVEITVKNYSQFIDCLLNGKMRNFNVIISEKDIERVKKFAVKRGDDNNSNRGHWYAHCNGYCMDLQIGYNGYCTINTYLGYRRDFKF